MHTRLARPPARRLSLGVAIGALVLAGCSSTASPSGSSSASASASSEAPSSSASETSSSPAAPSSAAPTASSAGAGATRCRTADLRFSLSAGDGAAGSTFYLLRIRNASGTPCRTGGFGGVSYVTRPTGDPVGAPATRVQRGRARTFTLQPGGAAEATLRETNAENVPSGSCRPTPVTGLRIYPPDETRSAFVRQRATACASARVHLLELAPYVPVG